MVEMTVSNEEILKDVKKQLLLLNKDSHFERREYKARNLIEIKKMQYRIWDKYSVLQ